MNKTGHLFGSVLLLLASNLCGKDNIMKIGEIKMNEAILTLYLAEMSAKLGCYFTFERFQADNHVSLINAMSGLGIAEDKNVTDIRSLISKLRHDLQGCVVTQSKTNPKVIHIIETPLTKLKDYVMEQKVSITYSGDLGPGRRHGLVLELSKKLDTIGPRTQGDNTMMFDDHLTKVDIRAKNEKARDILTNYVPLTNYAPFIWTAETRKADGKSKTIVQYFGPK